MRITVASRSTGLPLGFGNSPDELAPAFAEYANFSLVDVMFELNIHIVSDKTVRELRFRPEDDTLTDCGLLRIYPAQKSRALLGLRLAAFKDSSESPIDVVTAAMNALQTQVIDSRR